MEHKGKSPIWAYVLVALLTLIIYHGVVFRPGVLFGKDTVVQGYPLAWYEEAVRHGGHAPSWFPYMMSGFPTTPAIYPTDFLARLLPVTRFITWRCILHTFAAAALMFLMLRRFGRSNIASLIGAIAFGFSAFFIAKVYAGHGFAISTATWIPLTVLLLDRTIETKRARYAVLTGACLGLQILGQHPQYVFYTTIGMALYALWRTVPEAVRRRRLQLALTYFGLAMLAAIVAVSVSAHHLLPFAQLTLLSNRGGGTGYEYASSLSMHPVQIAAAAAPSFLGHPQRHNSVFGALYWDGAMYIGLLPLLLAVAAFIGVRGQRASYFKALAVSSVLIALGNHTPLYRLLYYIPGFDMIRAPSKALFLYTFAAAALAAYGMDLLVSSAAQFRSGGRSPCAARTIQRVFVCAFLALLAILVVWAAARGPISSLGEQVIRSTREDSAPAAPKLPGLMDLQIASLAWAAAFAGVGAATVALLTRRRICVRSAAVAILAVSFIDLWMYAGPLLYTVNARRLHTQGDRNVIRIMQSDPEHFRILPLDTESFQYAQGIFDGLESVSGYYPISLARYAAYVGAIQQGPGYVDVSANITNFDSPLVDLLNVKYVIAAKPLKSSKLIPLHSGRTYLYGNRKAFPRAFTVYQARAVSSPEEAYAEITKPGFDPSRVLILESRRQLPSPSGKPLSGLARVTKHSPTEVAVEANMPAAGYLVLTEVYYPDWRAWVDGKPAKIIPADYLFRAVHLPAGRHEVRMRLVGGLYRIGLFLTMFSAAFIAGMLIYAWRSNWT